MTKTFTFESETQSIRIKAKHQIPLDSLGTYANQRYSQTNCYFCGSPDHPMISDARTRRSGILSKEYICPIIVHNDLYNASNTCLQIDAYPCPYKFATRCKFKIKLVKKGIDTLYHHGLGDLDIRRRRKYIPNFEDEVIRVCNNFHRQNPGNSISPETDTQSTDPSQSESIQRLIPPTQHS